MGAGWARAAGIGPEDRVVVLGQGIVGNLVMQFARRYGPAQLIAVDALDLCLRVAQAVGVPAVVNASEENPVTAIERLTGGAGATVVIDCVGIRRRPTGSRSAGRRWPPWWLGTCRCSR